LYQIIIETDEMVCRCLNAADAELRQSLRC